MSADFSALDRRRHDGIRATMDHLAQAADDLPPVLQPHVGSALLNMAVERLLAEAGPGHAAAVLARLTESVLFGREGPCALQHSRLDS